MPCTAGDGGFFGIFNLVNERTIQVARRNHCTAVIEPITIVINFPSVTGAYHHRLSILYNYPRRRSLRYSTTTIDTSGVFSCILVAKWQGSQQD